MEDMARPWSETRLDSPEEVVQFILRGIGNIFDISTGSLCVVVGMPGFIRVSPNPLDSDYLPKSLEFLCVVRV